MTNRAEYEAAIEAHTTAAEAFAQTRKAHLAGDVTDAAFFAAKSVMDEADAAFDAAFEAEQNRQATEAEAEANDDAQMELDL